MKKYILTAFLLVTVFSIFSQNMTVSFHSANSANNIDSIWVTNLATGTKIKLTGNDSLLLTQTTGIGSIIVNNGKNYIYPNPCSGSAILNFTTYKKEEVSIRVHNISGQLLNNWKESLNPGNHQCRISFPHFGIYSVSILAGQEAFSSKIISTKSDGMESRIEYLGNGTHQELKNASLEKTLNFMTGNNLHYSIFSGKNNTIIVDSPYLSKTYEVEFHQCSDPDNNNYPVVKIGNQWWTAENLKTTKYKDGDSIPNVTDGFVWYYLRSGILTPIKS